MRNFKFTIFILALFANVAYTQIRIVVADFKNESPAMFLDSWERSVPDLLRAELSRSEEIIILERQQLDAIFEEQKLALAGFVDDSSLVQQIGKLMGAEIILSGAIYKVGKKYRIDVNITRVKTTHVISEKAEAPDAEHLKDMIDILANNIKLQLTGKGKYRDKIVIADYPTKYFLGATAIFATAAILTNAQYRNNLDKYHQNTELDNFDTYYDKANTAKKLSILAGGLGVAAFAGTLYCWIRNLTGGAVTAHVKTEVDIKPEVSWIPGQEGRFGVQISF